MDCVKCGAALPPKSDICRYCGTRNDTDLRRFDVLPGEDSGRTCPRCKTELPTISIQVGGSLHVERCPDCFGIFFDRHELSELLDRTTDKVHEINFQRLTQLAEEGRKQEPAVGYINCPVCQELMHRRTFGVRSGVIVNTCREHGAWLDGGQLGALLRWARLGGLAASKGGGPGGEGAAAEFGEPGDFSDWEVASAEDPGDTEAGSPPARRSASEILGILDSQQASRSSDGALRHVDVAVASVLRFLSRVLTRSYR